jgi:hypothetical protein
MSTEVFGIAEEFAKAVGNEKPLRIENISRSMKEYPLGQAAWYFLRSMSSSVSTDHPASSRRNAIRDPDVAQHLKTMYVLFSLMFAHTVHHLLTASVLLEYLRGPDT